jgi:Fatty acid desaturase
MRIVYSFLALSAGSSSAAAFSSTPRVRRFGGQATNLAVVALPPPTSTGLLGPPRSSDAELAEPDRWVAKLDYAGFGRDVAALGQELQALGSSSSPESNDIVKHLDKIVNWRNACAIVGILTMWMAPNPLTMLALSTWTYASWTMVAHHTCHGGYNRVAGSPYNSRGFARGSLQQRCIDWLDWIAPEAWNVEHNRLHHYRLNEDSDPDLVQRNVNLIRETPVPMALKYGVVAILAPVWKWYYYAPNTFKELQINQWQQQGRPLPKNFDPLQPASMFSLLLPGRRHEALREVVPPLEFFTQIIGPFLLTRLVLLPLPLLAIPGIGVSLYTNAMINLVAAELLTNVHAFCTIVTNHAGDDLYTFDDAVKPKTSSFYVRQIVGSANYETGGDVRDFAHGFLNYQIEHHVWPDLSMRQYQIGAPRLQALCAQYGVPYVQESVWARVWKTVDIMVGKTTMRRFPTQYEPRSDKATFATTSGGWKTTHGAIEDEEN